MSCVPRTVCPQFQKYESGECTGSLISLEEYSEQLKDMVTFVLDCSFSLERALEKVGLPRRDPKGLSLAGAYKVGTQPTSAERPDTVGQLAFSCGGENTGTEGRTSKF